MFSSYFKNDGQLETSQKKVILKYAKSWLLVDLLACIPINLIEYQLNSQSQQNDNYNSLLRLFRLPRLYRLLRIARLFKIFKAFKNYE